MSRRALIGAIGAAVAIAASDRADAVSVEVDQPVTRQQRRALERAGAIVIEADDHREYRPQRYDLRTERTHPMNPKKKGWK